MRREFSDALFEKAKDDQRIVVLSLDLGYKLWDNFREHIPSQFYNLGAAEHGGLAVAVGMALEGKRPFVYSATSFLVFRGFEVIRNYINHEVIPVTLVGSGRDNDYEHDGFSHWAWDVSEALDIFPFIDQYWPLEKQEIPMIIDSILSDNSPTFVSLKR